VYDGLSELIVTDSMHARKMVMAERADAFIALPGGIGTLEELFEVWTWTQLGLQHKPVGLLNVAGYFDGLLRFIQHAVEEEYLRDAHRPIVPLGEELELILLHDVRARGAKLGQLRKKEVFLRHPLGLIELHQKVEVLCLPFRKVQCFGELDAKVLAQATSRLDYRRQKAGA
jgi:hypothetical protein